MSEFGARIVKALCQIGIVHLSGLVYFLVFFIGENYFRIVYFHGADILIFRHLHECSVIDFLDGCAGKKRRDHKIEQKNEQQCNSVVIDKRFLR